MLDSDRIDLVGHDPTTDEYVLIIAASHEAFDGPAELQHLREKLNTYATFVLLGGLGSAFPDSIGKRVRIQVDFAAPPTESVATTLAIGERALADHGIGLKVNILRSGEPRIGA